MLSHDKPGITVRLTKSDNPPYLRQKGKKEKHATVGEKKKGRRGEEDSGMGREGGKGLDESRCTHRSG